MVPGNAELVFYHPLDTKLDKKSQAWTGNAFFTGGKVGNAAAISTISSVQLGDTVPLATVVCADSIRVAALNGSTVVACYNDTSHTTWGDGWAVIGTVSGNTVTWGSRTAIYTASSGTYWSVSAVCALDATKFVVGFSVASALSVRCGTITGTTITFGTTHASGWGGTGYFTTIAKLDASRFVAMAVVGSSSRTRAASVSGTIINFNAAYRNLSDSSAESPFLDAIGTTQFLAVWWKTSGALAKVRGVIGTVPQTTITLGTSFDIISTSKGNSTIRLCVVKSVGDGRIVVTSACNWNGFYSSVRVGMVSGQTISWGSQNQLYAGTISGLDMAIYGSQVFISYAISSGKMVTAGQLDGLTLPLCTSVQVATSASTTARLSATIPPLAVFRNAASSNKGTATPLLADTNMTLESSASFRSAVGMSRVTVAFWTRNPTKNGRILISRGYQIGLLKGKITFGAIEWNHSIVFDDSITHLIVVDFEYIGNSSWKLRVSIDGGSWNDFGVGVGWQSLCVSDTAPHLELHGNSQVPWLDEVAMWVSNAARPFSIARLEGMFLLANRFNEQLDAYSNHLLTVTINASPSVPVIMSEDEYGISDGTAPLQRTYFAGCSITITAPANASGQTFRDWTLSDGSSIPSRVYAGPASATVMNATYYTAPEKSDYEIAASSK